VFSGGQGRKKKGKKKEYNSSISITLEKESGE